MERFALSRMKEWKEKLEVFLKINELEKDILNKEIIEIASNKVKMKEMGEKSSTKSVKNVQEKIYAEIKKIVKGGK